jgi:uncharacterized GH25 family protein
MRAGGRPGPSWALLFVCALPHLLQAHDFWIELSNFKPGAGQLVHAYLKQGENFQGEPVARDQSSIARFVYGTNFIVGLDGRDPAGIFRAGGSAVVGYRSKPRSLELAAVKFEEYLWKEGLETVIAARHRRREAQKPGRELYSRYAKAVVGWGSDAAQPLGFRLELIPTDPPRPGPFSVRLVYENEPLAGALVVALHKGHSENRQAVRSDARGQASFLLSGPGLWLVKAVHMVPARSPDVDWESLWASLTFELP